MLPTVPSSEGRENFPEAVPVIAETPLVLPGSEGHRKLRTTGTTVWFTVEYCQSSVPGSIKDVGNWPTKLNNMSEREHGCSK